MELKDYENELAGAMTQLRTKLSECQMMMGIIESFLYCIKKETQDKNNVKEQDGGK